MFGYPLSFGGPGLMNYAQLAQMFLPYMSQATPLAPTTSFMPPQVPEMQTSLLPLLGDPFAPGGGGGGGGGASTIANIIGSSGAPIQGPLALTPFGRLRPVHMQGNYNGLGPRNPWTDLELAGGR